MSGGLNLLRHGTEKTAACNTGRNREAPQVPDMAHSHPLSYHTPEELSESELAEYWAERRGFLLPVGVVPDRPSDLIQQAVADFDKCLKKRGFVYEQSVLVEVSRDPRDLQSRTVLVNLLGALIVETMQLVPGYGGALVLDDFSDYARFLREGTRPEPRFQVDEAIEDKLLMLEELTFGQGRLAIEYVVEPYKEVIEQSAELKAILYGYTAPPEPSRWHRRFQEHLLRLAVDLAVHGC